MMRVGFCSTACPDWDLETIVTKASELGLDGVELHGFPGGWPGSRSSALPEEPERIRSLFQARGVELVCLATPVTLDSCSVREIERQKAVVSRAVELAVKLDCRSEVGVRL